jgi:hypothetical protein
MIAFLTRGIAALAIAVCLTLISTPQGAAQQVQIAQASSADMFADFGDLPEPIDEPGFLLRWGTNLNQTIRWIDYFDVSDNIRKGYNAGLDRMLGTNYEETLTANFHFWDGRASNRTDTPDPNLDSNVIRFFNYSLGVSNQTCYTCDFTAFAALSLGVVSEILYDFWANIATTLLGVVVGIYLLYQIGRVLLAGEQANATALLSLIVKRGIAVILVVMLISGKSILPGGTTTLWSVTGPAALETAFSVGTEVRERTSPILKSSVSGHGAPPAPLPPEWHKLVETYSAYRRTHGVEDENGNVLIQGPNFVTSKNNLSEVERTWLAVPAEQRKKVTAAYISLSNADFEPNDATMGCTRTSLQSVTPYLLAKGIDNPAIDSRTRFVDDLVTTGCIVERVHSLGIASGAATIFGRSFARDGDTDQIFTKLKGVVKMVSVDHLMSTILRIVTGCLLIYVFALGALRMIFMLLDISLRVFVVASFSPILAVAAIFPGTRKYVWSSMRILLGAFAGSISIAIVNILILILLTQVVVFYNSYAGTGIYNELLPIGAPTSLTGYKIFLMRIMGVDVVTANSDIPMLFSSPWLLLLLLIGVTSSATSKKIDQMVQQFVGGDGESPLADKAVQTGTQAIAFGKRGAMLVGTTMLSAVPLVGPIASGAANIGGKTLGGAVGGVGSAGSKSLEVISNRLRGG